jgi:hypothetical protein
MDDLWGGDSDDSDGFGVDGMAEHEMRVLRGRMANLGFQSSCSSQWFYA